MIGNDTTYSSFKVISKTFKQLSFLFFVVINEICDDVPDLLTKEIVIILFSFFLFLFYLVRMKHLMERIQQMWWLQAVVAVHIFLLEYSNQLVKLILHGSLLTIKIAK